MKIEIDLSDLFCEGEEPCDLQEAIRKEVVDSLVKTMGKGIGAAVHEQTIVILNEELRKAVAEQMPAIIDDLLTAEYVAVDKWGQRSSEPTTFRAALVKEINTQMAYRKVQYDSDKNAFTRAVDEVLNENLRVFKAELKKQVDADYTREVMNAAAAALKVKMGI